MIKKMISIVIIFGLILTLLSGCSKSKDKNEDITTEGKEATLGRYVEKDIVLPADIKAEEYVALAITPEGSLELYVYHQDAYEKYIYSAEKTWSKEDPAGLKTFDNWEDGVWIEDVFYGEDGRQYLLGNTEEYHNVLYRLNDQGEYEKIAIPKFDELIEYGDNPLAMRAELIRVLENGMITILFQMGELIIFSSDGQTVVKELNSTYDGMIAAEGNMLYYTDQNNELAGINPESGKEEAPNTIEAMSANSDVFDKSILQANKDSMFLCDRNGIHTYQSGGSLWETIIEGNQSSLSMPSYTLTKFLIGTEEDYYIVLRTDEPSYTLKHIYYDSNALSTPTVELSVFSLVDNMTIRQAVSEFYATHPEVKINYRVAKADQTIRFDYGIKNTKQTIPDSDYIKALNTELFAGRGADILVLDGLSVNSYIEKGVLEDMGDIFQPMINSGELLPNITENYTENGKVYIMPARIKLPVIYGKSEALAAADSLKELAEYAVNSKETPLFAPTSYRSLAAWCYLLYQDQLVNEDNSIDETQLQDFLKNVQRISENIQASDQADFGGKNNSSGILFGSYWAIGDISIYKKTVQANMEVLGDFDDFAVPITVIKQWDGDFRIVNHTYEENALVGINSAGKHKDLAREFVQLLFSEDIQSLPRMDGLPVNTKALDNLVQISQPGGIGYGTEELVLDCAFPSSEVKGNILEEIRSLSHPMTNDTVLLDMILDEAERYLRGDITVEEAVQNAVSSINTYLNE